MGVEIYASRTHLWWLFDRETLWRFLEACSKLLIFSSTERLCFFRHFLFLEKESENYSALNSWRTSFGGKQHWDCFRGASNDLHNYKHLEGNKRFQKSPRIVIRWSTPACHAMAYKLLEVILISGDVFWYNIYNAFCKFNIYSNWIKSWNSYTQTHAIGKGSESCPDFVGFITDTVCFVKFLGFCLIFCTAIEHAFFIWFLFSFTDTKALLYVICTPKNGAIWPAKKSFWADPRRIYVQ